MSNACETTRVPGRTDFGGARRCQGRPEWFAVDLLESPDAAGPTLWEPRPRLVEALQGGRLDRARLRAMAAESSTASPRPFLEPAAVAEGVKVEGQGIGSGTGNFLGEELRKGWSRPGAWLAPYLPQVVRGCADRHRRPEYLLKLRVIGSSFQPERSGHRGCSRIPQTLFGRMNTRNICLSCKSNIISHTALFGAACCFALWRIVRARTG